MRVRVAYRQRAELGGGAVETDDPIETVTWPRDSAAPAASARPRKAALPAAHAWTSTGKTAGAGGSAAPFSNCA